MEFLGMSAENIPHDKHCEYASESCGCDSRKELQRQLDVANMRIKIMSDAHAATKEEK
jgi:hypothetical protein